MVDSLASTILISATKRLKENDFVMSQPSINFDRYKFFFKINFENPNTTVLKI